MARDMSREGYRTLTHFKFEMVEMAEMAGMVEMATSICPFAGARYTENPPPLISKQSPF